MSMHTPEPWTLIYANDGRTYICGGEPFPNGALVWLAQVNVDISPGGQGDDYEGDANAVLMTAAPELLRACEDVLEALELRGLLTGWDHNPSLVDDLRAAITKAKGATVCV
jgi:hypothetical protein